ncbi:hypothetical protein [Streptomyces sp. NPDC055506]
MRTLVPGTIRHKAATDLDALQSEFEVNPVKVLVELLRETGERTTMTALRKQVEGLGIDTREIADGQWGHTRRLLLAVPNVRKDGPNGLRWDGAGSGASNSGRNLPATEALAALVSNSRKTKHTKQSLHAAVFAGLDALSPYELLAAHARGVPVTEWPRQWGKFNPERVPEEIRLIAVDHIIDMSRARSRIVLPGSEPSPSAIKAAEIPSSLELLPLLVPLVAMPAFSFAADKAVKALSGEHAWNALRTAMECFEQALFVSSGFEDPQNQDERLPPLATRAEGLLKTVLRKRPKEDDLPWLDFAEEMAFRARMLLADPRASGQQNGPVREWAQHVADHPDIPAELREAARAAQAAAVAEATEGAEADVTGDGVRTKEARESEVVPEVPAVSVEESESTDIEGGGDAGNVEPAEAAIATDEPLQADAPDETPKAAHEPERDPQAEIEALKRLLEEERGTTEAARTEFERQRRATTGALADAEAAANRLRLRIADEEKHRAEAETRANAAESKWESAQRDLEEAAQRAEAMTRQLRRRDDELRQSRQTTRGASQAQLRQARIDTLRVLATVLAEVADQAVHEGEETGPANALYRRTLARAAVAGVLDIGALGEETDYDPVIHRAPGGPAARVVVERPGFVWQGPREPEPIVLEQAIVRGVEQ